MSERLHFYTIAIGMSVSVPDMAVERQWARSRVYNRLLIFKAETLNLLNKNGETRYVVLWLMDTLINSHNRS